MREQMHDVLKRVFGYDEFRPGQEEIISAILDGRDVMAVLPTGGGKSLSYQTPALMLPGVTIVVSPLISLMKDQVDQLVELGVNAVMINGAMSADQLNAALDEVTVGSAKLMYVAPERIESPRFMELLRVLEIPLLVVDEAHCVSQWGHDFRPSYLRIPDMIRAMAKRPVVAAFTATATPRVREDIEAQLELQEPTRVITGFDRPNLRFAVENRRPTERVRFIANYVKAHAGLPGIVYCATRKRVDELAEALRGMGVNALGYHAGMADIDRERNQEAFINDEADVMVATNAFGMGIDKSNVRYVIHDGMSGSLEAYWQEAGRAGRDGEPAECVLLYSAGDQFVRRALIEQSEGDEAHKQGELEKLRRMEQYAQTDGCLRNFILNYFGESRAEPCGNCSNCETPAAYDVTREAQMALSCVARMERGGRRYGLAMVRDVLAGSANAKLMQAGLDQNPCYGLMKGAEKGAIAAFLRSLTADGLIYVTEGEYPVAGLTEEAAAVLRGDQPVMHRSAGPLSAPAKPEKKRRTKRNTAAEGPEETFQRDEAALMEKLRGLRAAIAKENDQAPFMVFSDASLRDMARKKPRTLAEFENVSGVGSVKRDRYGKRFIAAITGNAEAEEMDSFTDEAGDSEEDALMKELRALRMTIAREISRPPFMVFSDATLRDMARKKPATLEEFEQVAGVGSAKRDRYGRRFINAIARHTGGDGLHRSMAARSAAEVLEAHRAEWLAGLEPAQAQDAYRYVLSLLQRQD